MSEEVSAGSLESAARDAIPTYSKPSHPADMPATASDWLATRHFANQIDRPTGFSEVAVRDLHPLLRTLLFTDGTVTRALEAQTLSPVTVLVEHQAEDTPPARECRHLRIPTGTPAINRRVAIAAGEGPRHIMWAESYIVMDRLPSGFVASLASNTRGIGESLHQAKLEGWRELLWFGVGPQPTWTTAKLGAITTATVLTRQYRVLAQARPALLISESFPVYEQDGAYQLLECQAWAESPE